MQMMAEHKITEKKEKLQLLFQSKTPLIMQRDPYHFSMVDGQVLIRIT